MSFSCVEHEVVPPPTNNVDLNAHFEAYIDGNHEFTQNVSDGKGYAITPHILIHLLLYLK